MEGLIYISENLHGSKFFNIFFKTVTYLGEMGVFWIVLGLVLLIFKKSRTSGFVMLISLLIGFVLNDFVLKNLFVRDRPFIVNENMAKFLENINYELPSGYSMPSGHAFSSFNCAVLLTLFNKKCGKVLIPIAFLIAVSRIFLCVHYPSDVLVGMLLGIFTAVIVFVIHKIIVRKIKIYKRQRVRMYDKSK